MPNRWPGQVGRYQHGDRSLNLRVLGASGERNEWRKPQERRMRYGRRVIIAVVACLAASVPTRAHAQLSANRACPFENALVSVSFNGMDTNVSVARSRLDAKIADVKALAQEQHFTKFAVQSYNYNISTNNNGGETHFQYNGNVSFTILPADAAVGFMELLTKKGYQASVNVNSYNSGNCSQNLER
jgi:hypothetical protein